jgi:O-antigen ligase
MVSFAVMALVWGPRTRRLVIPTLAAGATFVILALMGVLPPILANRVTSVTSNFGIFDVRQVTLTPENFAVVERMAHWQAGWEMFVEEPLLGVGPGNYPAVYEQYYIRPWREPLGHAHNYYLNMAAEAGLPGLFALLVVLFLAFRTLLRRYRAIQDPAMVHHEGLAAPSPTRDAMLSAPVARALAVGLVGSLVMFCTHNLFDNLLVHGVGIQIGILLGLIGGVSTR